MSTPQAVKRKEGAMRQGGERSANWTAKTRERVGRLTTALCEARERGEVATACEPEVVAHFLVASLEGAMLMSRVTQDATVMRQCVGELERYLALYEMRS